MVDIPPILAGSKIHTETLPEVTKIWKVGQLLNATAERNVNAQGTVHMRMGQSILQAKTPIALKAGDPLSLVVKSLGDMPVLKILATATPPQLAAQNLKSFIAQQQDLTALLQLGRNIIENPVIPKMLKQQLMNLNQQLPTAEQATQAKTLKKIIQNSGVFLESKLNHLQTGTLRHDALQQDVKSQLLRINAQLKSIAPELLIKPQRTTTYNFQSLVNQFIKGEINLVQLSTLLTNQLSKDSLQLIQQALTTADKVLLPKELLTSFTLLLNHIQRQTNQQQVQANLASLLKTMDVLQELKTGIEGALAKITSQQLTPLTRETDSLLLLLFDLILKDKNENQLIEFRLEQEKKASDQNDSSWMVTLNFNFKELGPIQARLHLTNNKLSTTVLAEKESTVKSISNRINLLDTAFKSIGFDAINLDVTQGSIRLARDLSENVHILDEKA